jgi:polysaccharide biosynthesis protein PslG
MRRSLLACVASAALLLFPAIASASVDRTFWGVSPQGDRPSSGEFDRMGEGRVGTFRLTFQWRQLNPDPDRFRWELIDPVFADAARNGIKVLPVLYGTPDWIKCDLNPDQCRRKPPLGTPRAKKAWERFVRAAVRRYGPGGTFFSINPSLRGTGAAVGRWQVWNEQNQISHFAPRPSPGKYGKLLKLAARSIQRVDRGGKVVLGGMFGTPSRRKSMTAWSFLDRLYGVQGVEKAFEATAMHPYSSNLRGIRYQMRRLRATMQRHGDGGTDTFVTEIGWGSANDSSVLTKGLRGQARMLNRSFQLFLQRRREWNLKGVVWFSWRDRRPGVCTSFCASSGLMKANLSPKPAWQRFKRFSQRTR